VQTERFRRAGSSTRNSGRWIADNIWLEMSSIDAMLETIRLQGQTAAILFERTIGRESGLRQIEIVQPGNAHRRDHLAQRTRTRSRAATEIAAAVRRHCRAGGTSVKGGAALAGHCAAMRATRP
jgi:LysR family cyn operon transcriptional activator